MMVSYYNMNIKLLCNISKLLRNSWINGVYNIYTRINETEVEWNGQHRWTVYIIVIIIGCRHLSCKSFRNYISSYLSWSFLLYHNFLVLNIMQWNNETVRIYTNEWLHCWKTKKKNVQIQICCYSRVEHETTPTVIIISI
jgi:hypothetical protein